MNRKPRWSEAETLKLRAYAQTKYAHQIAELLGRSKDSVSNKAERLGIHLRRTKQWSSSETTRLIQLRQTMTFREIALVMNRSEQSLVWKAAELCLPHCRRYVIGANGAIRHSDKQVADCYRKYWHEQKSLTELAREYNTTCGTVFGWVNSRARTDATKDIAI